MSKIEKFLEDLAKVETLLEKMELASPADIKKAEDILQKMTSFASKDKYLSGNYNYFSGIIAFLKKDFKGALQFFSKSIDCAAAAGTSHGYDYLWKAYTHLALNEAEAVYTNLALAFKTNKKVTVKLKWMKSFEAIKETPEYKKALGIKTSGEPIDPIVLKFTEHALENSDLGHVHFLKWLDKEKIKVKDLASFYDAQVWASEYLVDDAKEQGLRDQDLYDEGPFTFKQLKNILKSAKDERKKIGKGTSYFHKMLKSQAA